MALSMKELKALTPATFNWKTFYTECKVNSLVQTDYGVIPTCPEEQKEYYATQKKDKKAARMTGRERKVFYDSLPLRDGLTAKEFSRLPLKDFPEDATKPLQSLTKTYITMMENETEKDDWNKALDILYPEKGE